MNREIKFRIWNGMFMEYNITTGKYGTFYVNPERGDGLNPEDTASLTVNTTKYHEGTPLMQFTGLKDKNGKDIYEGDIFEVAKNKKYQVKFCVGGTSNFEWYGGMFVLFLNDEIFLPFDEFAMAHGEVIGNIYENSELLDK